MRYLSILMTVTLTMLFISACQEESKPVVKEAPQKIVEQTKPDVVPAAATFSEETLATGKGVYLQTCAACHDSGMMGAPKFGDKAAWTPLAAEGVEVLTVNAIKGEGSMPPKGGNMQLSDDEVKAAVTYMVENSK